MAKRGLSWETSEDKKNDLELVSGVGAVTLEFLYTYEVQGEGAQTQASEQEIKEWLQSFPQDMVPSSDQQDWSWISMDRFALS